MSRDRADLDALLDATVIGHVAFIDADGRPGIMPTAVARWGDRMILHGSTGSRWMRLVNEAPVAVSVATVDGVVVARSAFESSLIYCSAVVFGSLRRLAGDEAAEALDVLTERLIPGRLTEVRASTTKELAATLVLAMDLDDWSLRTSDEWAEDADTDLAGDAWSGQVRFGERTVSIVPAPDLRADITTPVSARKLRPRH